MLECEKAKKFTLSKENSKGEWKEITEIYRKENKKKRKHAVIKVQDWYKIIKESERKIKIRKIKRQTKKMKGRTYEEQKRKIQKKNGRIKMIITKRKMRKEIKRTVRKI